ncbi:nitrous oxide reductase accessory protein NosL [Haladaptatus sp. F3-133]|uniref:Nitrous oxide reductase accessory protein NosL n=1 Tax=Halorutilus salinus TaxID=2487751 RepID=A0A9Q4C5Y1_9EURY|nr:nitrous oxide reductase accessory protein NosL [Halorutilus salinus]MCX2818866.1 nitrous oxide reductase accessory protein NosL [Halorutilus salinus]
MRTKTRRGFLAVSAALATGCLGGGTEELPQPISLDTGRSCETCGMIVRDHPGPVGQTYYRDNTPEGRDEDEPACFCSTVCLFDFYYAGNRQNWNPLVHYVTDYSSVEYEVRTERRSKYISAHLNAEDFADASRTTVVVGSDALGAMGPSLIPFTDGDDATAFSDEYAGDVIGFGDVTERIVDSL